MEETSLEYHIATLAVHGQRYAAPTLLNSRLGGVYITLAIQHSRIYDLLTFGSIH